MGQFVKILRKNDWFNELLTLTVYSMRKHNPNNCRTEDNIRQIAQAAQAPVM
jgi:hypothetical protein